MKKYQHLLNIIEKEDKFLLTSHVNPDGDSIGSLLALKFILESCSQQVEIVLADSVPGYLEFLPGSQDIHSYQELPVDLKEESYGVYFVVDCGELSRIGEVEALLTEEDKIINIDHHEDNEEFGSKNYVDSTVAATGELIYDLAVELGVNFKSDFGTAIATALITDTGNFTYANTSAKTHRIIADMLELGVDTQAIITEVYGKRSFSNLKLLSKVLSELQVTAQQQIAWLSVDQSTLNSVQATWEDTEGLVNYPRSLEGVEVGILFKEVAAEETRVSLRSNAFFSVNEFASYFGGGGHARAAGCTVEAPLAKAEKMVISKLKEELGVGNAGDN
ncbi:DHH family phosphoesterase [Fuchsiella alkaliacetigena]|uniref:DHH family phosphoesterase n=1 Tax=Fuchsiella alkaliacetigena TaxID=957042 RepID=UPI00200A3B78|nr:bifunctional oligoribonuclease/PAP phosphatase NrnA [Fuchsiella alkaliacetigena]MCK8823502.1 bifunctional oligoribonuclease/PAP phosphatase NrnA [Fuchsiella alkaliacetigena]